MSERGDGGGEKGAWKGVLRGGVGEEGEGEEGGGGRGLSVRGLPSVRESALGLASVAMGGCRAPWFERAGMGRRELKIPKPQLVPLRTLDKMLRRIIPVAGLGPVGKAIGGEDTLCLVSVEYRFEGR